MLKKNILLLLFCIFSLFLGLSTVRAANINLVGDIDVIKEGDDFSLTDYKLVLRKIGLDQLWQGGLSRDGEKLSFNLPIENIQKNDQLVLTIEAKGRNEVGREAGYFGGKTIVVTSDQVEKTMIDDISLEMRIIPIPEYEQTDEKTMKICWKGMSDFSVVGYEVYRSDEKSGDSWQSVGRSGQNANKQVCFLDSELTDEVVYYRLGILTSWNAGENKEVFVSNILSEVSDGLRFGSGVEDKLIREYSLLKETEDDQTQSVVSASESDNGIVKYWTFADNWINVLFSKLKDNNISIQLTILLFLAVILLAVIIYFVLSVWFSNVTSNGSNVWREK